MDRRKLLLGTAAGAGLLATGGTLWINMPANTSPLSLDEVVKQLEAMRGKAVTSTGKWSPSHIFLHNSQNIDYSMAGFPQLKSPLFHALVSRPALVIFTAKGAMKHGLTAPIPGGYEISDAGNTDEAIDKLLGSIARLKAFTGALHPHFAYGELSREKYEMAHVLHFFNHMSEIRIG
jgi:hypothetical protein